MKRLFEMVPMYVSHETYKKFSKFFSQQFIIAQQHSETTLLTTFWVLPQ